jgi:hypothetical protein
LAACQIIFSMGGDLLTLRRVGPEGFSVRNSHGNGHSLSSRISAMPLFNRLSIQSKMSLLLLAVSLA